MWIPESRVQGYPYQNDMNKRGGWEGSQKKSWVCYYNKEYCASKINRSHRTVCPLFLFSNCLETLQRKKKDDSKTTSS